MGTIRLTKSLKTALGRRYRSREFPDEMSKSTPQKKRRPRIMSGAAVELTLQIRRQTPD